MLHYVILFFTTKNLSAPTAGKNDSLHTRYLIFKEFQGNGEIVRRAIASSHRNQVQLLH